MEMIVVALLFALSSGFLILNFIRKTKLKPAAVISNNSTTSDSCQGCDGNCGCKKK